MKKKRGLFAIIAVGLMLTVSFQSVAGSGGGQQWDAVMDDEGYLHAVYVNIDPDFDPKNMTNADTEVFYRDNVGTGGMGFGAFWRWNEPVRLSYTDWDSLYPRIAIDDVLGYLYVIWIEKIPGNNVIMYAGSEDGRTWTYPLVCGNAPDVPGNPRLGLSASNGTLHITWKHSGHLDVVADSDGDMIPDNIDENPFAYDAPDGLSFSPDAVAYDPELGVSVAVDYADDSRTAPIINSTVPDVYLDASTGQYFSVETSDSSVLNAYMQIKINSSAIPAGVKAKQYRMYYLDNGHWRIMMKRSLGENTGFTPEDVVWAKSSHLSTFTPADTLAVDSDNDALKDGVEINVNSVSPLSINTFEGGLSEISLNYTKAQNMTVNITVPVEDGTKPDVGLAWLSIGGTLDPFSAPETVQPEGVFYGDDVYGNWLAYGWNSSIYVENLVTAENIKVSSHSTNISGTDSSPRIYGDWVVWTREKLPPQPNHGSEYFMMAWNFTSREELCLGNGGWSPDVSGKTSVWATYDGVRIVNLENFTTYTVDSGLTYHPKIWGNYLVYSKWISYPSNFGLFLYDLVNRSVIFSIENFSGKYDIAGNYLVYATSDGINLYNFLSGEHELLPETGVREIAAYEDAVVYTSSSGIIRYIDLWSRETKTLGNVVLSATSTPSLSIWGKHMIWVNATGCLFSEEKGYREYVSLRIGDEQTPRWSSSGYLSFSDIPEFSYLMNRYIRKNLGPNATNISVPLTIYSSSPGNITLSGLNVTVSPIEGNSTNNDTDGDGIIDGWEDLNGNGVYDPGETPGEWVLATPIELPDFIGTEKSRKVAGDVDMMTGNLRLVRNLISAGNGACRIALTLVYNSQRTDKNSVFGTGWDSPYLAYLNLSNSSYVSYFDGKGNEWRFKKYADGLYSSPPGTDVKLVGDSTEYYIVSKDGAIRVFNSTGRLMRTEDRNGRGLNMLYDSEGKLTEIRSDTDLHLYFTYSGNYITQISDDAGRIVGIEHNSGGAITVLTDLNGYSTEYYYNSSGLLTEIISPWGLVTLYNYTKAGGIGPWRVKNITQGEYVNGSVVNSVKITALSYTYPASSADTNAENQTSAAYFDATGSVSNYTDPSGIETTYKNDYYGHPTEYTDGNGNTYEIFYDAYGNPVKIRNPDGSFRVPEWFVKHDGVREIRLLRSSVNEIGAAIKHYYDSNGNEIRTVDPLKGETINWYDSCGRLIKTRDARGAETVNSYDSKDNLIQTENALGGVSKYSYDIIGRKISYTDPNGNTYSYSYDNESSLILTTDPYGFEEHRWYDSMGNLIKFEDKKGNIETYQYDVWGRKISETDALGNTIRYEYDSLGHLIAKTDARGYTTEYQYDSSGRLIKVTDPLGNSVSYEYDMNGNRIAKTDALGHTWKKGYDSRNRLIWEEDPLGNRVTYQYDDAGNMIASTDAMGNAWQHYYDLSGRKIGESDPLGNTVHYGYDSQGNVISVTDANNHTWHYYYDLLGRKIYELAPMGESWSFTYDANGNMITRTDPNGATTTYQYCKLNRRINASYEDGSYVEYGYNVCYCNPTEIIYHTAEGTYSVSKVLDALGRPVSVTTDYGNFSKTVNYTYDANGNVVEVSVPSEGRVISYAYDADNRVTAVSDSASNVSGPVVEYTYDAAGRMIEKRFAGGGEMHYWYDDANRMIREWYLTPEEAVEFSAASAESSPGIKAAGGVIQPDVVPSITISNPSPADGATGVSTNPTLSVDVSDVDADTVTVRFYDASDNSLIGSDDVRVIPEESETALVTWSGLQYSTTYSWYVVASDSNDSTTSSTWSFTTEPEPNYPPNAPTDPEPANNSYSVDISPTLSVYVSDPNGDKLTVRFYDASSNSLLGTVYDVPSGSRASIQLSGLATSSNYEWYATASDGEYTTSSETWTFRTLNVSMDLRYSYDADGRIVSKYEQSWNTNYAPTITEYQYDADGRLVSVDYPWGVTESYTYDNAGNRLTLDSSAAGITYYSYDNENRLISTNSSTSSTEYAYDNVGNMISSTTDNGTATLKTLYTYNYERQLTSIKLPSGDTVSYLYLPNGDRISRQNGTSIIFYLYDREDRIADYDTNGNLMIAYTHGPGVDEPLALNINNSTYFYIPDILGSITAIVDESGNAMATYTYDAWGILLSYNGTLAEKNDYLYTSREYDWQTGIYYYRYRYYDPEVGRFIQSSLEHTKEMNMYVYVGNDPVNNKDPTGHPITPPILPDHGSPNYPLPKGPGSCWYYAAICCKRYYPVGHFDPTLHNADCFINVEWRCLGKWCDRPPSQWKWTKCYPRPSHIIPCSSHPSHPQTGQYHKRWTR